MQQRSDIEAGDGEGLFVQTDVNSTADVKGLVAAAIERFGGLDGAFNNAGVTGPTLTPLADIDEAGWDQALTTNLRAVFMCMKYQIPALLARGGGAIVNMASMYGLKAGDLGNAPYCASKFGVVGLSKTAAINYADKGVRVNAICPGFIHSEMVDPYIEAQAVTWRPAQSRPLATAQLTSPDFAGSGHSSVPGFRSPFMTVAKSAGAASGTFAMMLSTRAMVSRG